MKFYFILAHSVNENSDWDNTFMKFNIFITLIHPEHISLY